MVSEKQPVPVSVAFFFNLCRTVNNPGSLQYQFCQRQFWTSYKLLGNVMKWQGILSDSTLQELVIDGLLNRYFTYIIRNC